MALAPQSDIVHQQTVAALRTISPQSATNAVKMAATDSTGDADDWDQAPLKGKTEAFSTAHACPSARYRLVDQVLLVGELFDDSGQLLTSGHAVKGECRYRYYSLCSC